jgi:hypothetical protein
VSHHNTELPRPRIAPGCSRGQVSTVQTAFSVQKHTRNDLVAFPNVKTLSRERWLCSVLKSMCELRTISRTPSSSALASSGADLTIISLHSKIQTIVPYSLKMPGFDPASCIFAFTIYSRPDRRDIFSKTNFASILKLI